MLGATTSTTRPSTVRASPRRKYSFSFRSGSSRRSNCTAAATRPAAWFSGSRGNRKIVSLVEISPDNPREPGVLVGLVRTDERIERMSAGAGEMSGHQSVEVVHEQHWYVGSRGHEFSEQQSCFPVQHLHGTATTHLNLDRERVHRLNLVSLGVRQDVPVPLNHHPEPAVVHRRA